MTVAAATTSLIGAQGLTKFFPVGTGLFPGRSAASIRAVDGVSFSIAEGETFSLVGESGCGKTTTARMLLMVERPTAGEISFRGKRTQDFTRRDLRQYRSSVQAVFQDPWSSLNPRMRVDSIIAEPLQASRRIGKQEIAERIGQLLQDVGLPRTAGRRFPHEFSGGQRQRIAIARALAPYPKLIVLDEPVSGLDVSIRAQIMNLLKDLQKQYGVSYLLIAHNLATVRYLADRVGVMYLGKIVEQGASTELFDNPLHPYTKALISASLASRPDALREEIILVGEVPSPLNPPSGCSFHPRCPFAMPRCSTEEPQERLIQGTQRVSCHLY